eukprot:8823766-Pyramimonas_sp.AAC.1
MLGCTQAIDKYFGIEKSRGAAGVVKTDGVRAEQCRWFQGLQPMSWQNNSSPYLVIIPRWWTDGRI